MSCYFNAVFQHILSNTGTNFLLVDKLTRALEGRYYQIAKKGLIPIHPVILVLFSKVGTFFWITR